MSGTTFPLPDEDARFAPGGVSEEEQTTYARAVDDPKRQDEDPGARAQRLRRRRRLLAYGTVPALLALTSAGWMGYLSLMTMAGHSAVDAGDYQTAISRYEAVSAADPWLEQWRVHYNLGTAHLLADHLDEAQTELERALKDAPRADWVDVTYTDGTKGRVRDPQAPECLVRTNLYAVHTSRWAQATAAGDSAAAEAERAAMTQAAGECEVDPPPQQQNPDDPSGGSSGEPSADPSADPSANPSAEPSAKPSEGTSSSPTPSPEPSAQPSPTPSVSDQERELEERNGEANPTESAGVSSDERRRW